MGLEANIIKIKVYVNVDSRYVKKKLMTLVVPALEYLSES